MKANISGLSWARLWETRSHREPRSATETLPSRPALGPKPGSPSGEACPGSRTSCPSSPGSWPRRGPFSIWARGREALPRASVRAPHSRLLATCGLSSHTATAAQKPVGSRASGSANGTLPSSAMSSRKARCDDVTRQRADVTELEAEVGSLFCTVGGPVRRPHWAVTRVERSVERQVGRVSGESARLNAQRWPSSSLAL